MSPAGSQRRKHRIRQSQRVTPTDQPGIREHVRQMAFQSLSDGERLRMDLYDTLGRSDTESQNSLCTRSSTAGFTRRRGGRGGRREQHGFLRVSAPSASPREIQSQKSECTMNSPKRYDFNAGCPSLPSLQPVSASLLDSRLFSRSQRRRSVSSAVSAAPISSITNHVWR